MAVPQPTEAPAEVREAIVSEAESEAAAPKKRKKISTEELQKMQYEV
jgi:hypothetical protein